MVKELTGQQSRNQNRGKMATVPVSRCVSVLSSVHVFVSQSVLQLFALHTFPLCCVLHALRLRYRDANAYANYNETISHFHWRIDTADEELENIRINTRNRMLVVQRIYNKFHSPDTSASSYTLDLPSSKKRAERSALWR